MVFGWVSNLRIRDRLVFTHIWNPLLQGESHDAYQQTYNTENNQPQQFDNQPSFGHEAIAGGAAFAGFKMFEDRQRAEGMLPRLPSVVLLLPPYIMEPLSFVVSTHWFPDRSTWPCE